MMGNLFRAARKMQKITQREIATRAGITPSALSQFETEGTTLSTSTQLKIAPLLNINPDFIQYNSGNPFKSEKLIKMHLPGLSRLDFSILYLLLEANAKIDFMAIHPDIPGYGKIFRQPGYGPAIMAVAVKDEAGNLFLFGRNTKRLGESVIVGMTDFQAEVNEKARKDCGKQVNFRTAKIPKALVDKIRDWSVEREDIDPLFKNAENNLTTVQSEPEGQLLRAIRERGIRLEDVEPPVIAMALEMFLHILIKFGKVSSNP